MHRCRLSGMLDLARKGRRRIGSGSLAFHFSLLGRISIRVGSHGAHRGSGDHSTL